MSQQESISNKWYQSNVYKWNPESSAPQFAIDTPPPTVSGSLHMGHVFSYTQADFIARFKRMAGYNVFYPIGFDDNGLPTEKLTEKIKGVRGITMSRESRRQDFVKMCKDVTEEAELEFEKLFKALGLSFDWDQKYQTISDKTIDMAHASFSDLMNKGLIYQASAPVYWCTTDQTALAQADIEDKELDSQEIVFICNIDGQEHNIMTTRPELIPACVMVLYHPEDKRFKSGQMVQMPFLKHKVPLVADDEVKIDKGTGLVMCCTYGDWQDVKWTRRHAKIMQNHQITPNVIISQGGKISSALFGESEQEQLNVKDARKIAIEKLGNKLISTTPIRHIVKCAERSGNPVEIISTDQHYIDFGFGSEQGLSGGRIKTEQLKKNLLAVVQHIDFKPAHLKQRLIDWINGLNQDWCISRNRFSGVPIPGSEHVFDTWFTSSISPQLNTTAIHFGQNARHDALFPMDLRPQAHEIIRTWAFYTIVKAYLHASVWDDAKKCFVVKDRSGKEIDLFDTNQSELANCGAIPWRTVMLSGWCLASDKTKMSKSKGNIVTPMPLIEQKSADVVRYWASCSYLGVDTHFNETKFRDGERLVAKIKNVAKFIAPHAAGPKLNHQDITELADKWIIIEMNKAIEKSTKLFESYDYCGARDVAERFFWHTLCDNYLEIIKGRIYGEQGYAYKHSKFQTSSDVILKLQKSAATAVLTVFKEVLRVFAPILPFITEEVWQSLFDHSGQSIHTIGNIAKPAPIDYTPFKSVEEIEKTGLYMLEIIDHARKHKADKQLSVRAAVTKIFLPAMPKEIELDLLSVINGFEATIETSGDIQIVCES